MKESFVNLIKNIENFWYYHKTHIILVALAIFFAIISLVNSLNQPKYDMEIAYYSINSASEETVAALTEAFCHNGIDINGDGEITVNILVRIADIESGNYADKNAESILTNFYYELSENNCPIYLMDETFKTKVADGYQKYIRETVCLNEFPKISERLHLTDDTPLYMIFMNEYKTQSNPSLVQKYEFSNRIRQSLQ